MRVVGDGRGGEEPSTDTDAHRRAPGVLAAEVWAVLARAGRPLNAAEVQEGLSRPLTYSTVITTLGRLHTKGLLSRVRDGRSHRYAPVADAGCSSARRSPPSAGPACPGSSGSPPPTTRPSSAGCWPPTRRTPRRSG